MMKIPRILITNDDGILSEGLITLANHLKDQFDILVIAPEADRSNSSHCLTLSSPVRFEKRQSVLSNAVFTTNGTPSDCVYLGLSHLATSFQPDLVVSGINRGFNLADDITYSGTVSAALEAALLDIPSVALSLEEFTEESLELAGRFSNKLVGMVLQQPWLIPNGSYLNVNIPKNARDLTFRAASVGRRKYSKEVVVCKDPRGNSAYWIGGDPLKHEDIPGSDCNVALDDGLIAVSPLRIQMTDEKLIGPWKKAAFTGFDYGPNMVTE